MSARLLLLVMLGAGCYQPSIAPCVYACDGMTCPDGLMCMANMCTTAERGVCGDGDAGTDVADGFTHVTVEVLNKNGGPFQGATVIFTDATGAKVANDDTSGPLGLVTATVPLHSNITVVRVITGDTFVTTFVDVWTNAHIVSQFDNVPLPTRPVTANFSGLDPSYALTLTASCFGNAIVASGGPTPTMATFPVSKDCANYDLLVVAKSPALGNKAGLRGNVLLDTYDFGVLTAMDPYNPALSGLPPASTSITTTLDLNAYVTEAKAYTSPYSSHQVSTTGALNPTAFTPVNAKLTGTLTFTGPGGLTTTYIERIGNQGWIHNMTSNTMMDFAATASFDVPSRTVTWATGPLPNGTTPPTTTIALGNLRYTRGTAMIAWRVVAPGTSVTTEGAALRHFVFPKFSDPRSFEPQASDLTASRSVQQLAIIPATLDTDIRSNIEKRVATFDLWDNTALKSISSSVTK